MHAAFIADDKTWDDVPGIDAIASKNPPSRTTACVGVHVRNGERLRVDIYAGQSAPFQDTRCVGDLVLIGFGEQLFIVDPLRRHVEALPLDGYFGGMYSPEDLEAPASGFGLLVTSASEVLCFSPSCELKWRTGELGVDGVVIHRIKDGVLHGDAEHDPPDGWEPFTLDFATGRLLSG